MKTWNISYDLMQKFNINFEVKADTEEEAVKIAEELANKADDVDDFPNGNISHYGSIYNIDYCGMASIEQKDGDNQDEDEDYE